MITGRAPIMLFDLTPEFAPSELEMLIWPPIQRKGSIVEALDLRIRARSGNKAIRVQKGLYPLCCCGPLSDNVCLIVAGGDGYLLALDDMVWTRVPLDPILDIVEIPGSGHFVLHDFSDVVCLDSGGIRWVAADVVQDDLRFTRQLGEEMLIEGLIYGAAATKRICLLDGSVQGISEE